MQATTNSAAASARGSGSVHASSTTTTGTIAMRKSERRFGSASTAPRRPTVSAMGGDEDDTRAAPAGSLTTPVVVAEPQNPGKVLPRLGDVWDAPHGFDALSARIVRRDRERHVAAVAVEQPLQMPHAALDVVARLEDVLDAVLLRGRGHELHQTARALRRHRAMIEPGLGLDDGLHERVLDVVRRRRLPDERIERLGTVGRRRRQARRAQRRHGHWSRQLADDDRGGGGGRRVRVVRDAGRGVRDRVDVRADSRRACDRRETHHHHDAPRPPARSHSENQDTGDPARVSIRGRTLDRASDLGDALAVAVQTETLVIGSGIAGLTCALECVRHVPVTLVTKDRLPESSSQYAQGGIASVWSPEDSFDSHIDDTLVAGAGLCHRDVVATVVREGPERVRELIAFGTNFDLRDSGAEDRDYDLGREGGHSHRRILHALDATGHEIIRALSEAVRAHPDITIYEGHLAIDL